MGYDSVKGEVYQDSNHCRRSSSAFPVRGKPKTKFECEVYVLAKDEGAELPDAALVVPPNAHQPLQELFWELQTQKAISESDWERNPVAGLCGARAVTLLHPDVLDNLSRRVGMVR